MVYAIGVNRIGDDGHDTSHSGDSMIVDPKGEILCQMNAHEEMMHTITLSLEELNNFRKKFPVGLDWDQHKIVI
jgi:predicted amidohydrolase